MDSYPFLCELVVFIIRFQFLNLFTTFVNVLHEQHDPALNEVKVLKYLSKNIEHKDVQHPQ